MTKVNSTAPTPRRKPHSKHAKRIKGTRHRGEPAKPYKDFPLFTVAAGNGTGRWAKKIKGKLYYFGSWEDGWEAALAKYDAEKDDIRAGRNPRETSGAVILKDLVNQFLTVKQARVNEGKRSPHTWDSYKKVCAELVDTFGLNQVVSHLRPEDFERLRQRWAKKWGVVRVAAEINRAKVVFRYALKNDLIKTPLKFGDGFDPPSKKDLLLNKAAKGPKSFEADELRKLLKTASQPLKAMILLGINAALGNNDIGQLPLSALDLDRGWLRKFPRPKTGVNRSCPLWPETVKALREWIAERPEPKDEADAGLVFLTRLGASWGRSVDDRPLTHEFKKLLGKAKIEGAGRGFYGLRHTFEQIGGASRDQFAVDCVMGHTTGRVPENYQDRDKIGDDRLQAVVEHVRSWLFGAEKGGAA